MKNITLSLLTILLLISSCSKEEFDVDVIQELNTIHEITTTEAAEVIRHNVLEEYGGAFKLFKSYHNLVRIEGVPCDTTIEIKILDEIPLKFTLEYTSDVLTSCSAGWGVYNDRKYMGNAGQGVQKTSSELFDLDINVFDRQTIAGNFEDGVYTYSNFARRSIAITKGISRNLEPTAHLNMLLPSCKYDIERVELTSSSVIPFDLEFRTNEGSPVPSSSKVFSGKIELIGNAWTILFDDGTSIEL